MAQPLAPGRLDRIPLDRIPLDRAALARSRPEQTLTTRHHNPALTVNNEPDTNRTNLHHAVYRLTRGPTAPAPRQAYGLRREAGRAPGPRPVGGAKA
ncbi:hypothetical protein [Streptomyces sp. PA5.6]|uniref:hypothetical protein n=1 Tax=Streptomyces sp. PA5.6 TaxID=3035651 RepID=UPI003904AEB8